jgi:hypothetical protein
MEASFIANCAAAAETRKMGNVPLNREEVVEVLNSQFA